MIPTKTKKIVILFIPSIKNPCDMHKQSQYHYRETALVESNANFIERRLHNEIFILTRIAPSYMQSRANSRREAYRERNCFCHAGHGCPIAAYYPENTMQLRNEMRRGLIRKRSLPPTAPDLIGNSSKSRRTCSCDVESSRDKNLHRSAQLFSQQR